MNDLIDHCELMNCILSASLSIIYCIDCVSILYAFFNIYFPTFLGFVIRKLHFHVMDSKIINAACIRAAVIVIATGVAIIEEEKNRIYIPREPRINAIAQREFYIDSILNRGDRYCVEQICMKPVVLYRLCDVLTSRNLLRSTQNVSIREQVIVFLQIVGQNQRFRVISGIYYKSVETIHRYFRIVLKAILKLYKYLIKDLEDTVPAEIMNNRRFYPYFKV
jgi:hypothetical protein